jgi:hypothetical protein
MCSIALGDVREYNLLHKWFIQPHSKVALTREEKENEHPHMEHAH